MQKQISNIEVASFESVLVLGCMYRVVEGSFRYKKGYTMNLLDPIYPKVTFVLCQETPADIGQEQLDMALHFANT